MMILSIAGSAARALSARSRRRKQLKTCRGSAPAWTLRAQRWTQTAAATLVSCFAFPSCGTSPSPCPWKPMQTSALLALGAKHMMVAAVGPTVGFCCAGAISLRGGHAGSSGQLSQGSTARANCTSNLSATRSHFSSDEVRFVLDLCILKPDLPQTGSFRAPVT